MAEYIDRDKLIEQFICPGVHFMYAEHLDAIISRIKDQPTADVSEVVRCKNCKNYELMKSGNSHFCNEFGGRVTEEDFCSRAQRMDGGNNNA